MRARGDGEWGRGGKHRYLGSVERTLGSVEHTVQN